MKNVIITFLVILLGISVFFNLQKQGGKPVPLSAKELLHAKGECVKYRQMVKEELEQSDRAFFKSTGLRSNNILGDVFYSPKVNSYLCVIREYNFGGKGEQYVNFRIEDILTGKTLYIVDWQAGDSGIAEKEKSFEKAVKEYE